MESLSSRQKHIISSPFPVLRASSLTRELPTCQKPRWRRPKQKVGTLVPILADSAAPEHVSVSRFLLCFLSRVGFFFHSLSLSHATVTVFDRSTVFLLSPTLGRGVVCASVSGPECGGSKMRPQGRQGSTLWGGETSLPKKGLGKLFIMVRGPQPPKPSAPLPPTHGSGTLILHSDKIIPQNLRRICTSVLSANNKRRGEKQDEDQMWPIPPIVSDGFYQLEAATRVRAGTPLQRHLETLSLCLSLSPRQTGDELWRTALWLETPPRMILVLKYLWWQHNLEVNPHKKIKSNKITQLHEEPVGSWGLVTAAWLQAASCFQCGG